MFKVHKNKQLAVHTWDWKATPALSAIGKLTVLYFAQYGTASKILEIETGCDEECCVIGPMDMTEAQAKEVYEAMPEDEFADLDWKLFAEPKERNTFEILQAMVAQGLDLRMSDNLCETRSVPQGGIVGMGVDSKTLYDVTMPTLSGDPKYHVILFVANKQQYDDLRVIK